MFKNCVEYIFSYGKPLGKILEDSDSCFMCICVRPLTVDVLTHDQMYDHNHY